MNRTLNATLLAESTALLAKAVAQLRKAFPEAPTIEGVVRLHFAAIRCLQQDDRLPSPPKTPTGIALFTEECATEEEEDPPITESEISGCKALLLEIIRRASYDWVLYRMSKVGQKRRLAEDAFNWMFKEGPGQAEWLERMSSKKEVTSFIAICEALDLNPDSVRTHIRRLTVKNVMSIGRPAEYRRQEWRDADGTYSTSVGDRALYEAAGYDDMSSFEGLGGDEL